MHYRIEWTTVEICNGGDDEHKVDEENDYFGLDEFYDVNGYLGFDEVDWIMIRK